jgi:hypothetical protein
MKALIASLCCLVFVAPAFAKLQITNAHLAHGMLGPPRESSDFYPLDEIVLRYQIEGARTDPDGKTDLDVVMRLTDAAGKQVFEQKSTIRRQLSLGNGLVPGYAVLTAPEKAPPGAYVFSVQVLDRVSSETASFEKKLECKPTSFQILATRFYRDAEGKTPAPAGGLVGETVYFKLRVVGFHKANNRVEATLTPQLIDEAGKPVAERPPVIRAALANSEEAAKATQVSFNGLLYLNRPGQFTLRFKVDDIEGKQSTLFETPFKVSAP